MLDDLQSVASAAKQGASYGARIRLPHAFVMTLLFQEGSLESKLRRIIEMTFVHGRNLALYAATYKSCLALLGMRSRHGISATSREYKPGRAVSSWHPLVAGGIGGYLIWGNYSGVNFQVSSLSKLPW